MYYRALCYHILIYDAISWYETTFDCHNEHLNAHSLQHKTQGRFNVYYTSICTNNWCKN